jgi:hypothetical protein
LVARSSPTVEGTVGTPRSRLSRPRATRSRNAALPGSTAWRPRRDPRGSARCSCRRTPGWG